LQDCAYLEKKEQKEGFLDFVDKLTYNFATSSYFTSKGLKDSILKIESG